MNLNELLMSVGGEAAAGQLGSRFGLDESQTKAALEQLIPPLGNGLQRNISSEGGVNSLLSALSGGNHGQYLDNPELINGEETIETGNGILGHLLGSKDASREVAASASAQTGIGAGILKQMLPLVATMLGMRQVYPGRYEPAKLLALIAKHGVTISHCVPTVLGMILNAPGSDQVDLSRWKVIVGGSALPEGLARAAMARGIDIHAGYGMSETCPILTVADMAATQGAMEDTTAIRIATGKPAPLVQLRIVDPDMRDVVHDGVATGEVVARAPWLTQGYLRNSEGTEALWRGGWLHTGDVGNTAADGTLRITDRLKDVIKSGGEWISSLEIESLVSAVPGVVETAVVGIPDPKWGERPVVLVVAKTDVEAAVQAAVQAAIAAGRLSKWAAPERVLTVAAIPKTSVGKIDKKAIRSSLAAAG